MTSVAARAKRRYRSADEDVEMFGSALDPKVVRRMTPYILPQKKLVAIAVVAMLIFAGTQVAVPWLIGTAIDEFISSGNIFGLVVISGIFLTNAVLTWISNFVQNIAIVRAGQNLLVQLRGDMFSHLQRQSLRFYDKTEVGRIMSRVQGDVYQLQEFLGTMVMSAGDFLSLLGIVVALLIMDWRLGLISLAVMPLLFVVMALWQPRAKKRFIKARSTISIVNAALNENISGVRVVQSMNRQEENLGQFDVLNKENAESVKSEIRMSAGLLPVVDILTSGSIALIIVFGSRMAMDNTIEVGLLVAFIMYIQRFFDPIRHLTMQYTQFQRAMASGTRIFETLDIEPDMVDAPDAVEMPPIRGDIELRDLSFAYDPGVEVTKSVNLHVPAGQTCAIVGPTGAGKTTLVSLIARFYDVERGRGQVLIDGYDVRDVVRNSLVSQMSMVLQEPFLFSGTVRENIKYINTNLSDDRMVEAAIAVGAHEFIEKLEDGYDTYLEERGVNLSVGQRQLLSFARAIVADPRILILDEATANIDSHTELQIQSALRTLLEGRTAVVIAHRLSTIRNADTIIVMNKGELVEQGTHDELMDGDGLYAHLYHMNYAVLEEVKGIGTEPRSGQMSSS